MIITHSSKYSATIIEAKSAFNDYLQRLETGRDSPTSSNTFSAFCVGMPKTGTHSIANIFSKYRSSHESDQIFMIMLLAEKLSGEISTQKIIDLLRSRQSLNNLEMDASHYNGAFIKELSYVSHNFRYILTVRDPYSWLDSWFNQHLNSPHLDDTKVKYLGRKLYFDCGDEYTKHDKPLHERGFYPLRSYLKFWRNFNRRVVAHTNSNNLLILRTQDISTSIEQVSHFLQIDQSKLYGLSTHEHSTPRRHKMLDQLDASYVDDQINLICGDTMSFLFNVEGASRYEQ